MKRILIVIAVLVVVLLTAAGAGWWWLTATQGGASFLLGQAQDRVERLEWRRLDGSLSGGLELRGVVFEQAGMRVEIESLDLAARVRPAPPFNVTVEWLRADGATLTLPPPTEPDPDAEPFRLGDYGAPVPVDLRELDLADFTILDSAGEPIQVIERLQLVARYGNTLDIERMALQLPDQSLEASGRIGLNSPWQTDLEMDLSLALDAETSQQVELELDGPIDALQIRATAIGPLTAQLDAAVAGLPEIDALDGRIELTGTFDDWPGIAGRVESIALNAEGGADDWQGTLKADVLWPELPPIGIDLEAAGDLTAARVERGHVNLLDGRIDLSGQADWSETLRAGADIELEQLDFTALYPDWPNQARVSGSMRVAVDESAARVEDLQLTAPPAELSLAGNGRYAFETESLAVDLTWQSLNWPPVVDESEPLFSSESGRFEARGTLEEWQAELEAWTQLPGQPRARLELNAEGDDQSASIRQGRIELDEGGALELVGNVAYAEPVRADIALTLVDFDPGVFVDELPGQISGDLTLALDGLDPLSGSLVIDRLEGSLRNLALSGSGAVAARGEQIERADLELSLGENRLAIRSAEGTEWQLTANGDRLDQLWPELAGTVEIDAAFDPARRRAEWDLQTPELAWRDYRATTIQARGSADWGESPSIDARFSAVDVDLNPWERLDQLELTVAGNCADHALTSYISGTRATLEVDVTGRLPGCLEQPLDWSGSIDRLALSETPIGAWQLDEPLPISRRDSELSAGPGCLWTTASDGRLCLNSLEAGEDGRAVVAFNAVPIDLLLLVADPVFELGSDLRGIADITWNAAGLDRIDARLLMSPGAVRMLGSEDDLIRIDGADLSIQSPTAGAMQARLALGLEGQSEIEARASIPNLNAPETIELDALANLDLPNLGAFNRLVPQLDELAGRLEGRLRVQGPLGAPEFDGSMAIREAAFYHAPLGSRIEGMNLTLEADESGGRLSGGFTAGEGRAEIDGQVSNSSRDGWGGTLTIAGEQLQLFDVDWLELTLSPDLELGYSAERLDLNGKLHIARARLGLPPGSEQRVAPSSDVVIVDGGNTEAQDDEEPPMMREIAGTLELTLSDDVRLEAAGMETRLAGGLDIQWRPGETMPTGRGSIQLVEGAYQAYGQNLEVREGNVLFTGYPIDNPVLNIEAVREVFGDAQVEVAGVRIRGPAQNPEIDLFTSPPTSREKALAYVLTGADFDHAGGKGAFSVGFWVLPNVFVSYGLGLFDSGNVLAARWELSRRWGLRATSGERDTGADVSFIIDR